MYPRAHSGRIERHDDASEPVETNHAAIAAGTLQNILNDLVGRLLGADAAVFNPRADVVRDREPDEVLAVPVAEMPQL